MESGTHDFVHNYLFDNGDYLIQLDRHFHFALVYLISTEEK